MWEAKAAPGRVAELITHVERAADPAADVYRSADDRVVVIDRTGRGIGDVPPELVARAPHTWKFTPVPRSV